MKTRTFTTSASALLLLATAISAKHGVHERLQALHYRHHNREAAQSAPENAEQGNEIRSAGPEVAAEDANIEKRGGQCAFPYGNGLVAVTPGSQNAGWAMSPDQPCLPGNYCPYACPAGQVSVQWDPSATSYSYPKSMNGGLYCDNSGNIQKPFPDKPYCQGTASNIGVVNNAGAQVAFCQTVLPGNEAMLIPTTVTGTASLAVPDTSYWCGTAAHYYINPPGVSAETACVWGTSANPYGNWSPYVAGANIDNSGNTFIKLGWNPIYLEPTTPFRNNMPNWGVKIDCPNGGCNGLPCSIDPSKNQVNQMVGGQASGAGGGNFCVVTVNKGSTANFVVFNSGGSQEGRGGQFYQPSSAPQAPSSSWPSSTAPTSSSSTPFSSHGPHEWSAWSASSSSSWSMSNSTSTHHSTASYAGPTGPPSYTLFNTAPNSTAGSSQAANTASASPSIQSVTGKGAAAQKFIPATGLLTSLIMAAIAIL